MHMHMFQTNKSPKCQHFCGKHCSNREKIHTRIVSNRKGPQTSHTPHSQACKHTYTHAQCLIVTIRVYNPITVLEAAFVIATSHTSRGTRHNGVKQRSSRRTTNRTKHKANTSHCVRTYTRYESTSAGSGTIIVLENFFRNAI